MKRLGDESGQTLILVAIGISVLLGFAAFATDIGVTLHERNLAQTAADSAAMAGAMRLHYGAAVVSAAALKDAAANGFTDGSDGATVTVSYPSSVGNYTAASAFVKVTVTKTVPGFFMKVFNRGSMDISASAVATNGAPGDTCIYVLNQTASDAMELQGSFDVKAPNCGIIVDSISDSALNFGGTKGTLTAGFVGVVGGASGQTGDSTPAPTLGVAPANDPLAWEPPPSYDNCATPKNGVLTGIIGPVDGGTVCYSGNVSVKNAYLKPGLYVFTGNVTLSGFVYGPSDGSTDGTLNTTNGQGVTLYIASGTFSTATNSEIYLTAPQDTGSYTYTGQNGYNGILFFQPLTNSNTLTYEMGNAVGTLTGIIYAPSAQLYIHDSGADTNPGGATDLTGNMQFHVDFVVNTFYDKTGTLSLTSYGKTVGDGTSPISKVALVE